VSSITDIHLRLGPWTLGFWDILLIVVVSLQAAVLAYVYDPKWKAFILSLPVPFTVAILSVGRAVDATNVLGLTLLFLFTQGVRVLHIQLRVPIVPAIIAAALSYCVLGWQLALVVPRTATSFWASCAATMVLAILLLKALPHREEPGFRTPLPLYLKLPIITFVIVSIVLMKQALQGFMTVFPMVGIIGAYEARHSLWTMGRQMPVVMLTMTPVMIVCAVAQQPLGIVPALALSWVVLLLILTPLTRHRWAAETANATEAARSTPVHPEAATS